jgi:hypothetical protein
MPRRLTGHLSFVGNFELGYVVRLKLYKALIIMSII